LPEHVEGLKARPEAANLVGIFGAITGRKTADVLGEFGGSGFGPFKEKLAEALVAHLAPIAARAADLLADTGHIDSVLQAGARRAAAIANPIVDEAERIVGFLARG
jgi:tryptophanyl-tRNA synthetase